MSSCSNNYGKAGLFSTARRPIWAIAIFMATCAAGAAQAATITVHPEDSYGRVFVDVAGDFTFADIKQFSDKVAPLSTEKVYVSLSSEGGSAVAAEIGDLIRLSGMKTLVPENKKCASVCAIIWLGARNRYVGAENAAIGFHGAYDVNTGQPGSTNVLIAAYLGYVGLSYSAIDWILGAPPLAIRWLTPETSKQYGIYYSELTPKRTVPFVDEQVANIIPAPAQQSDVPIPPQAHPAPPQLPQQSPQIARGSKRLFRVVDASDGFLNIRNGPGPTYQEIAKMPLGATGLKGRCVPLDGGWKDFCEVEWQGVSGWASSCCMAELEETTQFSYRVIQNLILRSGPDKSSSNMLTNYAPNDYIPEGTIFTWKKPSDAGNCTGGLGGEIWCRLTYTHDHGIRTDGWVSAHFLRSTTSQMLLACFFQNPDPNCADDGAAPR